MRIQIKPGFEFALRVIVLLVAISTVILWVHIKICDVQVINRFSIMIKKSNEQKQKDNRYNDIERSLQDQLLQEKGTKCTMPNIDPFSVEFTKFYKSVSPITCDGEDWVECKFSQCCVKKSILDRKSKLSCIYRDIIYVNDDKYNLGKPVKVKSDGKYKLQASDFVRVSCKGTEFNSSSRWQSRWRGHKAGYRTLPVMAMRSTSLNVFMLIIDSVSRNAFIRRMPISYGVLKDELLAVVMNSYNVVGCGTNEAMWPILTGHNELELSDSTKRPGNTKRVDPKPFIFTLMKEHGYRTAFLEDMPWTGTFNSYNNGFEHMPTDHYMRHLSKDIGLSDQTERYERSSICFGSESIFKFIVEYSAKLFKINSKMFCVSVTSSYSHDDVNTLILVDDDLAKFLRKFKRDGHLKNTMLLIMGDHGPKNSDVRNTYAGKIDEHRPFMSMVLPESLKAARPDALANLMVNSEVLSTPFDVHTTILDVLGLKDKRNKYKVPGAEHERGMSLLKALPETRGCAEAGIVPEYCICTEKWHDVPAGDVVYTKVVQKLTDFVNEATLHKRHKCAKRVLHSIEQVGRRGLNFYQAKIIMYPGKAIFEGSMIYNMDMDSFSITDTDVSRIDNYGDEANCVILAQPHLSKYCYCV